MTTGELVLGFHPDGSLICRIFTGQIVQWVYRVLPLVCPHEHPNAVGLLERLFALQISVKPGTGIRPHKRGEFMRSIWLEKNRKSVGLLSIQG